MGHTLDVHNIHYRATSDAIERSEIAKPLLVMDFGKVGQFKGKQLQEIQMDGKRQYLIYTIYNHIYCLLPVVCEFYLF